MSTLVKVQPKGQMTIPRRVRSAVGLVDGDLVEVRAVGKKIVITPQLVIDRTKFPTADDEYTPAQRRIIDVQLAEGLEDIRKGRVSPKFDTVDELLASLKAGPKSRLRQKKTRSQ
jgi:AbrB family looped-hinge helix DNA binding protein